MHDTKLSFLALSHSQLFLTGSIHSLVCYVIMLESSVSGEKFKFHKLINASFMDKLYLHQTISIAHFYYGLTHVGQSL